ncbi:MAG: hypothetical protein AAFU85_28795, partial [Planctomycetota bacterium]
MSVDANARTSGISIQLAVDAAPKDGTGDGFSGTASAGCRARGPQRRRLEVTLEGVRRRVFLFDHF